jgi:excisionase family DNA binding protein
MDVKDMTILTSLDHNEFKNLISQTVSNAVQLELSKVSHPETTVQKQFFSRQETAEILGISLVTLDSYIKAGFINAFRLGYKVRFKHSDILQALTQINVR